MPDESSLLFCSKKASTSVKNQFLMVIAHVRYLIPLFGGFANPFF